MKAPEPVQSRPSLPSLGPMPAPNGSGEHPPMVPDYELLRRIGGGAYGEVWLARSKATEVLRATKIVWRSTFNDDRPFQREFEGIQRFERISREHPSQLALFHIGRNDAEGYFYYVMELADDAAAEPGGVLEQGSDEKTQPTRHSTTPLLQNSTSYVPHTLRADLAQGPLPAARVLEIGLALTEALAHLHSRDLVHRDVKPSNVIFVNGKPKLADIGLVTDADTTLSYVGTEGYIPPEGPGAAQADIFSLGKVLYEISTGQDRRQFPDLPPNLKDRPDQKDLLEINEVLVKACARDVRSRYQSCEEMCADLIRLQRGQSVKRHRLWQRRWGVAAKLGIAAAVLALLITALPFLKGFKRGHTPTPEAMQLYRMGQFHYSQFTPDHNKKAIKYLSQAVAMDPKFVLPYRELTALYVWGKPGLFTSPEERIRKLKEIADKLLTMARDSTEGHAALSWYRFLQQDWKAAEDEIVRAIEIDPNYPTAREIYAFYLSMLGKPDEALRQAQRSEELDRTARTSALVAAWPFFAARQFDKAIVQLQRVVDLDDNYPEAYNFLGRCFEAQSNFLAAIEAWRKYDLLVGHDRDRVNSSYDALRQAYLQFGEQGYLRKFIELIRENESLPEDDQIFYAWDLAGYYARLGENEKALDEIETHLEEWRLRSQLKFEPMFDSLHDLPRFKALLKRAGLEP